MTIKFDVTEWHQVASIKTYEIDDEMAIEVFGSVERLMEVATWQEQPMFGAVEPVGEEPTEDENDSFWELTTNYDYDRYDDWWTDRKGGYEVTVDNVEIEEDE